MSATILEVNAAGRAIADLHALWLELSKVVEQVASAGEYADEGAEDLARYAALEGVTSLRLGFARWLDCATYKQFATQEREAYAAGEGAPEQDTLLDKGLLRLCGRCATEIRECSAIPGAARKQLVARLQEVSAYGAGAVLALVAQAAVVERALKAKAH
jgi:hypothetical protein